jgi:predicted phage-related endonuclease
MSAKELVRTIDLSREEWLQWRRKGIGGSDAAAIAGLNPWKSPIERVVKNFVSD